MTPPRKVGFEKSLKLFERAKARIPSVCQTFSKGYTQFSFGVSPIFASRAKGASLWDVDGNEFIDLPGALGPIILGHQDPRVDEAVIQQIRSGVAFSLPHENEFLLAERLGAIIPHAEMIRFGTNGSDATTGAVRVARALTGREHIACCGYHGWHDWYIGTTLRKKGVPQATQDLTHVFKYNDLDSLKEILSAQPIACVMIEAVGIEPPKPGFLEGVVKLAHDYGAVVVFDECWTGFRFSLSGVQGRFGVKPDISCFGKAIANGYPISVIAGKREIMKVFDDTFFSFTFGGSAVGLAAALKTLDILSTTPVIERMWSRGEELMRSLQDVIRKHQLQDHLTLKGFPPRSMVEPSSLEIKSLLQQEFHQRGFLYNGFHVLNDAMDETILQKLVATYDEVLAAVKGPILNKTIPQALHGSIVQPVFRKP